MDQDILKKHEEVVVISDHDSLYIAIGLRRFVGTASTREGSLIERSAGEGSLMKPCTGRALLVKKRIHPPL
jgi:hypothetical protein